MPPCRLLSRPRALQLDVPPTHDVFSSHLAADRDRFMPSGLSGIKYLYNELKDSHAAYFSEWRTFDAIDAQMKAAAAASGGTATLEVAGNSLEERDIDLVRFTGAGYLAGQPKVVLTFSLQVCEWITVMAGAYAVERLVETFKASPSYLDEVEVIMMPMANPDGFLHTEKQCSLDRISSSSLGITSLD